MGKKEALRQLDEALNQYGIDYIASEIYLSTNSVKKLKKFYELLPNEIIYTRSPYSKRLFLNQSMTEEEDRTYEFKEIKGSNSCGSIQNTVDKYGSVLI